MELKNELVRRSFGISMYCSTVYRIISSCTRYFIQHLLTTGCVAGGIGIDHAALGRAAMPRCSSLVLALALVWQVVLASSELDGSSRFDSEFSGPQADDFPSGRPVGPTFEEDE
eukprot:COSAG02_NODE_38078_length_433_cov_2.038922_1_plen_113_part_01